MEITTEGVFALLIGVVAAAIFLFAIAGIVGTLTAPRRARLEQEQADKAYRARNARMSRRK